MFSFDTVFNMKTKCPISIKDRQVPQFKKSYAKKK